ncbi:OLC1v1007169C1 [Oldenlandia corymbosa var. corymbosa]|uniref:OLC1v1007169C1 n=1 Tax=Oldenlandia corymbosa var. corymbosa TaxID=529605 RepID=A0AAV1DIY6_OLDCO|nr:OLC1v1007169C1 [Oldenlandia corymbosa var. corymbosa]
MARRASSSSSSGQYIEDALSCTNTQFALSYSDPAQKWIIRQHLMSLFQDFPSFKPSIDTFTHNDGTTVNLLKANGELRLSSSSSSAAAVVPSIFLTIWINENYPSMAPLVYVSPSNSSSFSDYPESDHPFVDSSGATISSYLSNWNPGCNLSELVRNLVKLFSSFHPFCYSPPSWINNTNGDIRPSFMSKREAIDRLACSLHFDLLALSSRTEDEIWELSVIQSEIERRGDVATSILIGLEEEHDGLKERVKKMTEEADVLLNWLKVHTISRVFGAADRGYIDDAFEGVDQKSKLAMECVAADQATEDLMYVLDKAVEVGIFGSFDAYMKQVRILARAQFSYKYQLLKLRQNSR